MSRLCLLLAFAGVLAGAAAVDDTATPVAQPLGERACKGELQFGTEIAVRDVRTATVVPDAIVFDRRDGHVHATVKAGRYTWPKARCQIDVELRDSRDTVLASSHAILESCGEIISFPGVSHAPFAFPLGREEALTEATHFVLRLLPLVPVPRPVIGARPRKASPGEATESSGEALSELRRELKGFVCVEGSFSHEGRTGVYADQLSLPKIITASGKSATAAVTFEQLVGDETVEVGTRISVTPVVTDDYIELKGRLVLTDVLDVHANRSEWGDEWTYSIRKVVKEFCIRQQDLRRRPPVYLFLPEGNIELRLVAYPCDGEGRLLEDGAGK